MILVFGQTGQVARELARAGGVICLGRDQADLTDPAACAAIIRDCTATAVINAAAFTAVDRAETEEGLATTINGDAPTAMAQACAARDLPFVHISTDYVFDGGGTNPRHPHDPTTPLNAYGRSKRTGEVGIIAAGGPHAILRTSWVVSAHGSNFVKTMLRLGADRDALSIVADQIGGPTPARDIAAACLAIAAQLTDDPAKTGIYHFAGAPDTSWADFAGAIFAQAGVDCTITPILTSDYPTPAARPRNSRLNCDTTKGTFAIPRPDWRAGLTDILSDLKAHT